VNCFRSTEIKCIKNCTLARVWRQRCSCCHNCGEHNNVNYPVSGKIMPAEVAASSWGSACVPGACLDLDNNCQTPTDITAPSQRRQWAWLRRQQASFNFRLSASLLKRPFASAANATSERSIFQREYRKRYGTFALRNARQLWRVNTHGWSTTMKKMFTSEN